MPTLPLDHLHPHPRNANVMPEAYLDKLVAQLERTDRYPPLIVRPHPEHHRQYQLLDGHHRAKALRRLGRTHARCEVWDVDEAEALVLLASLNRLQGRDQPRKRAALLHAIAQQVDLPALAQRVPEDVPKLRAMLARHAPPPPRPAPPPSPADLPEAVTFFLREAQRTKLDAALAAHDPCRETALMKLVAAAEGPGHKVS